MQAEVGGCASSKHSFSSWISTVPFLIGFGAILVAFDPLQRIALRLGRRCHEAVVVWLNASILGALGIVGMRLKVSGACPGATELPLVVVSNHQSMFDVPILHTIFRKYYPRFVAKKELGRWIPSISFNLQHGENALIDRGNPLQAAREIRRLAKTAKERRCAIVIFPEGTRSRQGRPGKFHSAGLQTLLSGLGDALVVPVALNGSWRLGMFRLLPVPWRTQVEVKIGKPIRLSEVGSASCSSICESKIQESVPRGEAQING